MDYDIDKIWNTMKQISKISVPNPVVLNGFGIIYKFISLIRMKVELIDKWETSICRK